MCWWWVYEHLCGGSEGGQLCGVISLHLYMVVHWTQVARIASLGSKRTSHLSALSFVTDSFISVYFILFVRSWTFGAFVGNAAMNTYTCFSCENYDTLFCFLFFIHKSRIGWWFGNPYLTLWRTAKLFAMFLLPAVNEGLCFSGCCQCLLLLSDFGF